DTAGGLEYEGLETGVDWRAQLQAEGPRALDELAPVRNVGRRDPVHHLSSGVAEHALGADIENLDDAVCIGGDAREVGTVEDGALQRTGLQYGLRVAPVVPGLAVVGNAGIHEWLSSCCRFVLEPARK